jgi:hypothetical protein
VIHPVAGVTAFPLWQAPAAQVLPPSPGDPVLPAGAPAEFECPALVKESKIKTAITTAAIVKINFNFIILLLDLSIYNLFF